MKRCFKCNEPKELTEFYKHKAMSDGYLNKCKSCTKADSKKREEEKRKDPVWVEAEKRRSREKYHRLNYKEKHGHANKTEEQREATRKARVRYIETHPWVSNWKYKNLSRKFKVKKGLELHHWCYIDLHLECVYVLTKPEHDKAHLYLTLDLKERLFRNDTGELLDTKIKHYEYLLSKGIEFVAYFPNPETQKVIVSKVKKEAQDMFDLKDLDLSQFDTPSKQDVERFDKEIEQYERDSIRCLKRLSKL